MKRANVPETLNVPADALQKIAVIVVPLDGRLLAVALLVRVQLGQEGRVQHVCLE